MRIGVRTRLELTLDDAPAVERHDHHLARLHPFVRHARRLDDHTTDRAVNAADVTPCLNHKALFDEVQIRLADLLFEYFEHGGTAENGGIAASPGKLAEPCWQCKEVGIRGNLWFTTQFTFK